MRGQRKKYKLTVRRLEVNDFSDYGTYLGTFTTIATSKKAAWKNIRFRHGFNPYDSGDTAVSYSYKVISEEPIDPVNPVGEKVKVKKTKQGVEVFPDEAFLDVIDPEEEKKPLYITKDGIEYILTDNGEYTEIYD